MIGSSAQLYSQEELAIKAAAALAQKARGSRVGALIRLSQGRLETLLKLLRCVIPARPQEREAAGSGAGAGPGSAAGGGAPGPRRPEEKGAPSRAIAVEEVFANPNMLLPRKRGQDRKARAHSASGAAVFLRIRMSIDGCDQAPGLPLAARVELCPPLLLLPRAGQGEREANERAVGHRVVEVRS